MRVSSLNLFGITNPSIFRSPKQEDGCDSHHESNRSGGGRASYQSNDGEQTLELVTRNMTVSLAAIKLPTGTVNQSHARFNPVNSLTVKDDPAFSPAGVQWRVAARTLPAGIQLSSAGPRGWSVSVLFYALLPLDKTSAVVQSKVEALEWSDALAPGHRLAFDHSEQLTVAVRKLRAKVAAHVLSLHLLPEKFTLRQLQQVTEVIVGHPLDKSSFRRRLKESRDLVELDEYVRGAQRPAQLFRASETFSF